jgi:hypothetical protein
VEEQHHVLDCSYPPSFLSNFNKFFVRFPLLSRDVLCGCVRRFRESIPKGCQTKGGYIKLIEKDFMKQTNQLMQASFSDLLQCVSTPSLTDHLTPLLLLVCQIIHNRYGAVFASQLLCSQACWNPPEVAENATSQPVWLETPLIQLRLRLAKVDTGVIEGCCDLYLVAPSPAPKLKTERCNLMIQRFRTRSLHLLSFSDVNFVKEYIALIAQNFPGSTLTRTQLVEALLRAEFGDAISEKLMSLPSSEMMKKINKPVAKKHKRAFMKCGKCTLDLGRRLFRRTPYMGA